MLGLLPMQSDPNLLVGLNMADDAGVYLLDANRALVQTLDFFPPVVDDPFDFGRVAAANALSDVYAMGGKPLTAMNIAAFPEGELDQQVFVDILRGGAYAANQAGVTIVGGHTVKDKEIKYGLSVTGIVDPSRVITNAGARAGDVLLLTKPIGSGVLTTALRAGKLDETETKKLVDIMARLNDTASQGMISHGAAAGTDITGFGLLGHAFELAEASGVSIEIEADRVPLMDAAYDCARNGHLTAGGRTNRLFLGDEVRVPRDFDEHFLALLFDPQTSGGLLIAVDEASGGRLLSWLEPHCPGVAIIGTVVQKQSARIMIV
jgi:selenide,water dikinase